MKGSFLFGGLLLLVAVVVLLSCDNAEAQSAGSSLVQFTPAQGKLLVSSLIDVSPNCRAKGKVSSLAVSQEKKDGVVSFRPKLNRPCTATFAFTLSQIEPELISSLDLTFRYNGPTSQVTLSGPQRTVTANGFTFLQQQNFELLGDGRTFQRFLFSFEEVPRDEFKDPVGDYGLEYLFKGNQLLVKLTVEPSKKKILLQFDEMHLAVSYFVPGPYVTPNKVDKLLSSFESSIGVNKGKPISVDPKVFKKVDSRIVELWTNNVGTTIITNPVVVASDNAVLIKGTTTLPTGATADISQGIVTTCDSSSSVCSVAAVSKICFTAQNYQTSIVKGYVGQQFASLPSVWFEVFNLDFTKTNCIYFSTGEAEFEGLSLHPGVNINFNGFNSIFNPIFLGKPLALTGLIGLDCGDGCLPSQDYQIYPIDVKVTISDKVTLKLLAIDLHEIILLPNDISLTGLMSFGNQDVTLVGSYTLGGQISLTATLNGCWKNPFGIAPFLKLCDLGGNVLFDPSTPKFFVSASLFATGYATFAPNVPAVTTLIVTVDGGVALIISNLPFGGAISSVVSAAQPGVSIPSELNEIVAAVPVIQTLAISTFDTGSPYDVEEGFTIILPIKVTGDFANTLNSIFPDPSAIQFSLKLRISQDGFVIALMLNDLTIYAGMKIVDTSLSLTIAKAAAPILAIQTGLEVQIQNNPGPLTFIVIGTFQGKSITIGGAMVGDWVDPFGLRGFTLGDVGIEVGFGPPVPPALIRLGITAKLVISTKYIRFATLVDIQQPQQMMLYGELSDQNGQAFTLGDIIQLALLVANKASGKNYNWDLSQVPVNWGLDTLKFKIAPTDATIATIEFKKGFEVEAGIDIFGINLQISIRTSDLTVPGVPFPLPDFNLNFLLDLTEFNDKYFSVVESAILGFLSQKIQAKVSNPFDVDPLNTVFDAVSGVVWPPPGMDFSKSLFLLNYVSINNFGFFNFFTANQAPQFSISVTIFGKDYSYQTPVTLFELQSDLSDFMNDKILDLLNIPDCVTSIECGSGHCSHLTDNWRCVDSCPSGSFEVPGVGCFRCSDDAACAIFGGSDIYCINGGCVSQSTCDNTRCKDDGPCIPVVGGCVPFSFP